MSCFDDVVEQKNKTVATVPKFFSQVHQILDNPSTNYLIHCYQIMSAIGDEIAITTMNPNQVQIM